jgi:hypothetical protein
MYFEMLANSASSSRALFQSSQRFMTICVGEWSFRCLTAQRLVARRSALYSVLNPEFVIDGLRWVLNPLEIVSVPVVALGEKVGSLGGESDSILMSLDEWFSRAWN